jgi:hypothetical protein
MVLTRLTLKTKAAGKRPPLIKTPRACPSRDWKFTAHITYADGTGLALPGTSRCG